MRTRLKYHILTDNVLVTDWFTVRANYIVRGRLNTKSLVYTIEEFDGKQILIGKKISLRLSKIALRENLIDAGVILGSEIRQTTP